MKIVHPQNRPKNLPVHIDVHSMPQIEDFAPSGALLQVTTIFSSHALTNGDEWTVDPSKVAMAVIPGDKAFEQAHDDLARQGMRPLEIHEIHAMVKADRRPSTIGYEVRIDVPMEVSTHNGSSQAWVAYNPFDRETPLRVETIREEGDSMPLSSRTIATYPLMEGDLRYEVYLQARSEEFADAA